MLDCLTQMRNFIQVAEDAPSYCDAHIQLDREDIIVESSAMSPAILDDLYDLASRLRGIMETEENEDYIRGYDMAMQRAAEMVEGLADRFAKGELIG